MITLNYAKAYLNFGWSLIPIIPKTKCPPIKWAEFQTRKATLQEVEEWLKNDWFLAVVTGDISGVLVVDDDRIKHNLPEWGFESPVVSKSQSGGKHYYFKYDREIHSHSNTKLFIDLKAWHSYCLLPPFNGREWINKPSQNLSKLQSVPDEIVRLINSDLKENDQKKEPGQAVQMTDFLDIPEGARTDSLHRIACSIFKRTSKGDGIRILSGINLTYKPPLTQKEFEYQVSRAYSFITSNQDSSRNKTPAKFLTLQDIGKLRNEDRLLEKDAPKTGYGDLDKLVKGFIPKHFWTLTGETNVGKTALACNFAHNVILQKKACLYVALEPEYRVVDYLASIRLKKKFEELTDEDILFEDPYLKILTLQEVPTYPDLINSLKANSEQFSLIIIDHIGYFCRSSEETSFLVEQGKTIRELVAVSKELKTCVLAIAHPRKPTPGQKNRVLNLYDVSGSAAFGQDSTEVIVIHRPTVDEENKLCFELSDTGTLLVQKTKAGRNGAVNIYFHKDSALIHSTTNLYTDKEIEADISSLKKHLGKESNYEQPPIS